MELKPCPFCGNMAIIIDPQKTPVGVRYRAVCPKCMAMVSPGFFQNEIDAASAWNKRSEERTGKWIRLRKNYSKCSECGTAYNHPVDWVPDKYCSECGAKMIMEE